jgi:ATP-dependent helicase HrpB
LSAQGAIESLPIEAVLAELRRALSAVGTAVLVAPPGAGKTTAVAPALLGERWCTGQILLTSPRRIAARAAAERMAQMLGEAPGQTIGYLTRLDSRVSTASRVVIMTEAILVNRLVEDPELADVSAILFDEAHERHVDSDLALALALETREVLREDLRLLVMSATIDGARFARLLGEGAPVIESEGRSHPLRIEWLGSDSGARVEAEVERGIMQAWGKGQGDILAFLPGVAEIERTREQLAARLADTPIHALHGQVDPAAQRAATRRDPQGRRRVVLASAIAETSLTLDGISAVVDSGLARLAQYDRAGGTTRLVTRRASRAAADQRAGRAARQGPGIAYRLWEEGGHLGRPEFAPPEIETADLAPLILKLAQRGTRDPGELRWLDPPPDASVAAAQAQLARLGALGGDGPVTQWGTRIAAMPMAPDHAAAILHGAKAGCALGTARLVILLQERGLGGRSEDLAEREARWRSDGSRRANSAARIAKNWAEKAQKLCDAEPGAPQTATPENAAPQTAAECLALARPDFVARRRDRGGVDWLSVGGRGFTLDPASPLARAQWIVIGDAQGQARGARIMAGVELDEARIEALFASTLQLRSRITWDAGKARVDASRESHLGAIVLSRAPDPDPDPAAIVNVLVDEFWKDAERRFPPGFLARARFAGIEALSLERLRTTGDLWLTPLLHGRRDLDFAPGKLAEAALALLDWPTRERLERDAPRHFTSPAGTGHAIDYAGDDGPSVEVRVQALFGLDQHPVIGSSDMATPLLLKLTSPAGRPIQTTRDLPGFWRGSWADVAKDMKGRYPKHRWPQEPWHEKPSLKTKNAFNRG